MPLPDFQSFANRGFSAAKGALASAFIVIIRTESHKIAFATCCGCGCCTFIVNKPNCSCGWPPLDPFGPFMNLKPRLEPAIARSDAGKIFSPDNRPDRVQEPKRRTLQQSSR
jgi:hypothetical protein